MSTEILKIVMNDSDVAPLTLPSIEMINKAFTYSKDFKNDAELFETVHGHIIVFNKNERAYHDWQKGKTERLAKKDLDFFAALVGFRWVESTLDKLSIGFKNTP